MQLLSYLPSCSCALCPHCRCCLPSACLLTYCLSCRCLLALCARPAALCLPSRLALSSCPWLLISSTPYFPLPTSSPHVQAYLFCFDSVLQDCSQALCLRCRLKMLAHSPSVGNYHRAMVLSTLICVSSRSPCGDGSSVHVSPQGVGTPPVSVSVHL